MESDRAVEWTVAAHESGATVSFRFPAASCRWESASDFSSVYGKNRVRILLESHPDWVLRDRKRQPVEAFYDPGVAIDPANPELVAHLASECRRAIAQGYDGVMADETFMVNPLPRGFGGINRETGRVYSLEEWRQIKYESLQAAKVALGPGKLLLANSIAYGEKYFREQGWRFLEVVDGVVAENFRGPSGWSVTRFFDLGGWKQNVAMVEQIQRRGKSIIATAKYSSEELRRDPEAVHQHQLFTLGTFLLATDGSSAFSSSMREPGEVANNLHREPFPFEFAAIGRPEGKYRVEGDLYVRKFERATVVVNPTARTLTWRPPGSAQIVVLSGHSARIELVREP